MKIGFVLDDSLDKPDGVQQYVLTLGKWLSLNGHEVCYLAGQTARTDIPNVYSLGPTMRVTFNANVVGTPWPVRKNAVSKLLSTLKLDILHVQLPYSPFLAGRVIQSVSSHTAVLGTLHTYPISSFEHFLNRMLTVINTRSLTRFDDILAVSSAAAQASNLQKTNTIAIIPNPVYTKQFQKISSRPTDKHKLVFLGRLVPRKGCMLLLQSLAQLVDQGKLPGGWTVEVGGTGHLGPMLEAFVAKHGLAEVVSFKGFIKESDKPDFLAQADLAVFPSSGGESFGIVLLEAMAAGTMVLAGNNPGYACVLGTDSRQLFETKKPDELTGLLAAAMASAALRQKIVKQQSALVKAYDIQLVGRQIEAVYKKALHSRSKMG